MHYDRPYDEKVSERIQEYKAKVEQTKETQAKEEVVKPCVVEGKDEEKEVASAPVPEAVAEEEKTAETTEGEEAK